jgi:2-hydroxychromene-2-carboxylate isomerase
MRACCAADAKGKVRSMSLALFTGYWARDIDPSSDEGIVQASAAAGLDSAEILLAIQTQPIKDRLRANTDEALRAGAFGAPTIVYQNALFWGNDRLAQLDKFLTKTHG